MRLTIILIAIWLVIIIAMAAQGLVYSAIYNCVGLFYCIENFYLRSKLKTAREIMSELTTDELADLKNRIENNEQKVK